MNEKHQLHNDGYNAGSAFICGVISILAAALAVKTFLLGNSVSIALAGVSIGAGVLSRVFWNKFRSGE